MAPHVQYVYAIHTERDNDAVGAVEVIHAHEADAKKFAKSRSTDPAIRSAVVTRYEVGQLGTRYPAAWYVDGREQDRRPNGRQLYPAG